MTYRMPALLAASLAASLLCACATTRPTHAKLTYQSVPDGAQIFEGEKLLGAVPVTQTYASDGASGNITTPDVRAVWPSGAQTTYFTIVPVGSDRVATIERPPNAPGLQQDQEHGKQVADARKRDAARNKQFQQTAINEVSARCLQEQAQGNKGIADDCK